MELKKYNDDLKYQLRLAYNRTHSKLHLKKYKIYFKDVQSRDLVAVANAQVEARANVPNGICSKQRPTICDLFEADSWKAKFVRNKKNRAKMKTNHTAGASTFINVIHKKNEMKSMTANFDNTNAIQEDIVLEVLGECRSGHVRGNGCGAIRTRSNFSSARIQQNHDDCLAKQLETKEKLTAMLAEIKESKASQAPMEAKNAGCSCCIPG
ncbi:uncharacterized protein LOC132185630 [Corylus avellana]|uniref:uncharacterized protein LOC132185630 n=1 Tax=Corylus avellana TaxID=13451 RepID=UPI00286CC247|nr:uncharacterized protein LOC132185630 [Corylus avellana]